MRHGAISVASLCLFNGRACHDLRYAQQRLPLTVPLLFLVSLATLMLEDNDFGPSRLPDDRSHHTRLLKVGSSNRDLISFADHEHGGDLDALPRYPFKLFNTDHIALANAVLFAAGLDDSVHADRTSR